jgi:hypothetical protein
MFKLFLFPFLMPVLSFAEVQCFHYLNQKPGQVQVLKNNVGDFSPDKNRNLVSLTAKIENDSQDKAQSLYLVATVELKKHSRIGAPYEKISKERYEAYLYCDHTTDQCHVECDGGRVQVVQENKKLILQSNGVRLLDCGGTGKEIWMAIQKSAALLMKPVNARYCR